METVSVPVSVSTLNSVFTLKVKAPCVITVSVSVIRLCYLYVIKVLSSQLQTTECDIY